MIPEFRAILDGDNSCVTVKRMRVVEEMFAQKMLEKDAKELVAELNASAESKRARN